MRSTSQDVLFYILAYLLWLVSIAACVAVVLQLQSAVNALGAALGGNRYTLRLANHS